MATVIEQLQSRGIRFEGTKRFGRTEWIVTGEDIPIRALKYPQIPNYGQGHPSDFALKAKTFETGLAPGHNDVVLVGVNYELAEYLEDEEDPEIQDPIVAGFSKPATTFNTQFVNTWREPPFTFVPPEGNADNTVTTDIGGKKIDVNAQPVSRLRRRCVVEVFHTIPGEVNIEEIAINSGKRISNEFLGADPGKLLYMPKNSSPQPNGTTLVTHNFEWDENFHLVQVPLKTNGKPDSDGGTPWRAATVFWRQPFPDTFDIALIGVPDQGQGTPL